MGVYLRRWPALLLALPGAAAGFFFTAGCDSASKRCLAVTTPHDVLVAVIVGAAVGVVLGVLLAWGQVYAQRTAESLASRFPDSLVFSGFADSLTRRSAVRLGFEVARSSTLVGVANLRGIQLWAGNRAHHLLVDAPWPDVGCVELGDPSGDMTRQYRSFVQPNYERVSIEISQGAVRERLQFAIYTGSSGGTRSMWGDAFDIRQLTRKINGYRAVFDRGQSAG